MSLRTASFFATYTATVDEGNNKTNEDIHKVNVSKTSTTEEVAVYTWDFDTLDNTFATLITEIASSSILNMQVAFKYNNNQDFGKLSLFKYGIGDPATQSGGDILSAISVTELVTSDILSADQTGLILTLEDLDGLYYESLLNIVARDNITVAFKRHSDFDTSDGSVELSGKTLVGGTSEWRVATTVPAEPLDAPLLIITYDIAAAAHPRLNVKFTTLTPTVNQTVPSNSLGKYIALNDVSSSSSIRESIGPVQRTIPIDTSSALPTKIGLGSVGPEIFQYTSIDTTNHRLSGVVRGIAPNAFPAGFDSFRIAENVYFLQKDATNDLHLLFDTNPANDLIQYRCLAITNVDSDDDFNITSAVLGVIQNANAKSQIVIGVELPRWDSISGTAVDVGSHVTISTLLVVDNYDTILLKADGFYDEALIKITDLSGNVSYTIATSFDTNNTTYGRFILSPAITGLAAGWSFVIMPAPAQQLANDATAPTVISGRFSGFSEDLDAVSVNLLDHGTTMQENDLFYVWIKRTLTSNTDSESDTGAVLILRYRDI